MAVPLFSLGQLVATPGTLALLADAGENPAELLVRHQEGDWLILLKSTDRPTNCDSVGCTPVGSRRKLYDRIVSGRSDANIPFEQTRNMLLRLGFKERVRGSHHIFTREGIEELIDIQEVGGECKPYQVKQMRAVLKKYNLREEL